MATKSITKNITIRTPKQCAALLNALEGSAKMKANPVTYQRPVKDMSRDEIQMIFGDRDDRIQSSQPE